MFKIIIASHGPLAKGMRDSLYFFYPDQLDIAIASIDEDGLSKFQKRMDTVFEEIGENDFLFFTDLLYGTPFNEAGKRAGKLNQFFAIVAGVNMPILIEAANLQRQGETLDSVLPQLLALGQVTSFREKMVEASQTEDE